MPITPIYLVDDDPGVRKALSRVLREEGLKVEAFESAEAYLARPESDGEGCLVLDVTMPGLDGLELQKRLVERGEPMPIVFITGHGDIPMTVQALKAGASDFLAKPVAAQALVRAVRSAIERDASARLARAETATMRERFASLTPREREVLTLLAAGHLNKQIAADAGYRRADGQVPPRAHHGTHGGQDHRRAHAYRGTARGSGARFGAAQGPAALGGLNQSTVTVAP